MSVPHKRREEGVKAFSILAQDGAVEGTPYEGNTRLAAIILPFLVFTSIYLSLLTP
jgi:hypothetical protein